MQTFSFSGRNAAIPPKLRRELLQKWLGQEQESLAYMHSHGEKTEAYQRRINDLQAQLSALETAE